jgi:hypothetical protein
MEILKQKLQGLGVVSVWGSVIEDLAGRFCGGVGLVFLKGF